ncbi:MAG: hypothetical protein R8G66_31145 [Cytophagales bacterium]|nr:hypothetical protein [Cytophagales bacterium]
MNAILGSNRKKGMTIRYSKSGATWQVYNEGRVVYLGTKSSCREYVQFMSGSPV